MKHWISYIIYFAIDDLKRQNARSKLGYFWIVLSQFVNIIGIALVFGIIFRQNLKEFFPYISAGIISWNFSSTYISDSTKIYLNNTSTIQNFKFPVWIYIGILQSKALIIFLHGLVIQILINIFFSVPFNLYNLLIFPNLLLILIFMFYLGRSFAYAGARFRDFAPAVSNAVYLFFLITPIIWQKNIFPESLTWMLYLNPFTSFIDLLRSPILGKSPDNISYYITTGFVVCIFIVQSSLIKRRENKIVFYL